ncbi:unnamed protein product [Closterium sp. Naga37s-1]|nr:unnamed protein product [Closterium sp. Naga37s-1]
MGRPFKHYLQGARIYSCSNCRSHAADHDEIISKSFQGRHGRAYLFSNVVNVMVGPKEDRLLITGLHTVADIYCAECHEVLGWKYEKAYEDLQKYKEGKFILEKAKLLKENCKEAILPNCKRVLLELDNFTDDVAPSYYCV